MAGTRGAKPDPQSPVGAYGDELRRRREAAGYTQQALADEVVCSPSLIAHYEAGRRKPQREDARRLDRVLAADGFFERFLGTLDSEQYAEHFVHAAELERLAVKIQSYASSLVPGILQTAGYARAVFAAGRPNWSAQDLDKRVVNRLERARILEDPGCPVVWALLDENVLRRRVGGSLVMAEQLEHLSGLGRGGRVRLHVVPFSVGEHALMESMVVLMKFADAAPIAYVEGLRTGRVLDAPTVVDECHAAYDLALGDALPQRASLDLIDSLAKDYRYDHEA